MASLPNAFLAELPHGAALVVHPEQGARLFADSDRAVKWLERGKWDYYVTHQQTDTGDEYEQWIPLLDARHGLDLDER